MSDNMPDFDSMSQEEIMAWMETLAKRQGASEGFTTTADMDIAEIDPDTVVIDEPGYVPYGQERAQPAEAQQPKPEPRAAPAQPSTQPSAPPETPRELPPIAPLPAVQQPAARVAPPSPPVTPPTAAQTPAPPPIEPDLPLSTPVDEGALAWLESLAADQSEELFNLDLSELAEAPAPAAPPAPEPVNPMTWLEDLARSQVAEPSLERLGEDDDEQLESEKLDPFAEGVDSMEWMETLARRQGAPTEELTTRAGMNIPVPAEDEVEETAYQPFSFDTPPAARRPVETPELSNPADWLTSLAGSEGYSEEGVLATQKDSQDEADESVSLAEIQDAIADGTVTREQMQFFLDRQAEQLTDEPLDLADEEEEVDEPLVAAELPDWLSELKPEPTPEPTQPIEALFEAPPAAEMPDWLREDTVDEDSTNLESIFVTETDEPEPITLADQEELVYDIQIDPNDPWVEALDYEYEQGAIDLDTVPAWYEQNINDPERIASIEGQVEAGEALQDANLLPQNDLPEGQPQPMPGWVTEREPAAEEQVEENDVFAEMPDWLREVEASVSPDDVPDWLVETIGGADEPEPEQPAIILPQQEIVTPPAPTPIPTPQPQPQPPVHVAADDASEVIVRARDKEQNGDLEGALADYEGMIRANVDIDTVVADLAELVKSYKTTPAVYRVLGDGLMRQGKLQAALNTYREALNQL